VLTTQDAAVVAAAAQPLPTAAAGADAPLSNIVDALPTDAVLSCLVECAKKLQPPVVCEACQNRETAEAFCLQCNEGLCDPWTKYHKNMSATRRHEVVPLASLTPQRLSVSKQEFCPEHPDVILDLYCPTHAQPLCSRCFSTNHRECSNVESIADAAKRQRQVCVMKIQSGLHVSVFINRYFASAKYNR
jgi:hypothetical protein